MEKYILSIEKITKSFKKYKVLDNISLEIERGSIYGLVGESGCGKTTLAKIIVGLVQQDFGRILYNGFDLNKLRATNNKAIYDIQIVFQDPLASLNPKISVRSTLEEVVKLRDNTEILERTISLLSDVGLDKSFLKRYPFELSGGQAQRICIARSLAVNPKFLILDEPLSSLDFDLQESIIQLLLKLKEEKGLTYLFITHDILLAKRLCDFIAVMKAGKILESGKTEEVLNKPKCEYTKQLLDDAI